MFPVLRFLISTARLRVAPLLVVAVLSGHVAEAQEDWSNWRSLRDASPVDRADLNEVASGPGSNADGSQPIPLSAPSSPDDAVTEDALAVFEALKAMGGGAVPASETAPLFATGVARENLEEMRRGENVPLVVGSTARFTDSFRDTVLLMKLTQPYPSDTVLPNLSRITFDFGATICTGVFVSDATILTAAHCICDFGLDAQAERARTIAIWGGDFRQFSDPRSYDADQPDLAPLSGALPAVTMNPQFCEIFRSTGQVVGPDVGLAYMDLNVVNDIGSAEYNPAYRPANFAWPGLYTSGLNAFATVVGFGITTLPGNDEKNYGMKVTADIPVVDMICGHPQSRAAFGCNIGEEIVLIDQLFGNDTCNGDSGGPAYLRYFGQYYLVGITSRAAIAGTACGTGGIYTLLTPRILGWIRRNTRYLDPSF